MKFGNEARRKSHCDLTLQFVLEVVSYCETLQERKKFVIANQLLNSGTSVCANIQEAQNAESMADFIHTFKIAAKEIEVTFYWLEICKFSLNYPNPDSLITQLEQIASFANNTIITSKQPAA